ncbi:ADP-ribosylglycohydrolase family protein [Streptomyces griseiscabiei]|uniref:ADP-ribosylglycohydrolase family protein n=1 Tax=Streptomyces griseiscabiei TaxID=2993540 RepID=UPI00211AB738|nr:ADP-ribosylglycohydrolase family protein [Streptomyces griseiscabiei]
MPSIACIPPAPASGDAADLRERARGAMLGLAVGDALGAPAENMKPSEIRARWGRITGYVAENPSGTDDTEYAIFSGLLLARHGSALTVAHVETAWHQWIADLDEGPFRGAGFSERGTLENLRRGLAAPISAQHRHAWSDGLAMRAAPFGVFAAGRPAEAARLVAVDGSVSHDGEGIYGGQAVAAGQLGERGDDPRVQPGRPAPHPPGGQRDPGEQPVPARVGQTDLFLGDDPQTVVHSLCTLGRRGGDPALHLGRVAPAAAQEQPCHPADAGQHRTDEGAARGGGDGHGGVQTAHETAGRGYVRVRRRARTRDDRCQHRA